MPRHENISAVCSAVPPANRLPWSQRAGLLVFSLVLLLPGTFRVSLVDRDEGWYAQVSREMLAGGDWLIPHYLGEPWIAKPPLLYWCVASSYALLGVSTGAARLVPVLAAALSVQLVATLAVRLFNRRVAWFAAISFITAGLPLIVSKMLLTDALLLPCVLAAILLLWRIASRGETLGACAAFWLFVGLAALAKGPAVIPFVGAFAVGLCVRPETRHWLRGPRIWLTSPISLLVCAPWYVYAAQQAGSTLVQQFLWYEVFSRLTSTPHGHGGPPGYHLAVALAGWLPWTALVPGALLELWRARREVRPAWLLLLWCGLPWLLLELISSKLPHYALPCYVPIAIILGQMWDTGLGQPTRSAQRVVLAIWAAVPILLGAGLVAVGIIWRPLAWSPAAMASGLILVGGFGVVGWFTQRGRLAAAWTGAVASISVFYVLLGLWLLPGFEPYRLSRTVAAHANAQHCRGDSLLVCGYEEPSTFFYLDQPARVVSASELAGARAAADGPLLLIAGADELAAAGVTPDPHDPNWQRVAGFNYVKGRHEVIWIGRIPTEVGMAPGKVVAP
jgi:4-amino-4-deoxy-L-arabinose transferase-like glycosyltransferase